MEPSSDRGQKRARDEPEIEPTARAEAQVRSVTERVDTKELGFCEFNRGDVGILGPHIHRVAEDIHMDGVKLPRYGSVKAVEVPHEELEHFREYNKRRCEEDDYMPPFHPSMKYMLLAKTHFTHALKLDNRLVTTSSGRVKLDIGRTEEGRMIQQRGVVTTIYKSALYYDVDALKAIMREENLNSRVELQEDEMSAYACVSDMLGQGRNKLGLQHDDKEKDAQRIVDAIHQTFRSYCGFPRDHMLVIAKFRLDLPDGIAEAFRHLVFAASQGRIRIKVSQWKVISDLPDNYVLMRVALMIMAFKNAHDSMFPPNSVSSVSIKGNQTENAPPFPKNSLDQLKLWPAFLVKVENILRRTFRAYGQKQGKGKELNLTVAFFFHKVGNYLLKVGEFSSSQAQHAKLRQGDFTHIDFARCVDKVDNDFGGGVGKIETEFRKELVSRGIYTESELPGRVVPKEEPQQNEDVKTEEVEDGNVKKEGNEKELKDVVTSARKDTMDRLGMKALPAPVRLPFTAVTSGRSIGADNEEVKKEELSDPEEEQSDEPPRQDGSQPTTWDFTVGLPYQFHTAFPDQIISGSLTQLRGAVATVEVSLDSESHPQWELFCSPDCLLAPKSQVAPLTQAQNAQVHPLFMDAGTVFEVDPDQVVQDISSDLVLDGFSVNIARLYAAYGKVGGDVAVEVIGEVKDPTMKLRARATREFKKGELVLLPAGGVLALSTNVVEARKTTPDHKALHSALLQQMGVRASVKVAKGVEIADSLLFVGSPLLEKRESQRKERLARLSRFWAVLQTHKDPNMVLEHWDVEMPPPLVKGISIPNLRNLKMIMKMPVLVNRDCKVGSGDILTVLHQQ